MYSNIIFEFSKNAVTFYFIYSNHVIHYRTMNYKTLQIKIPQKWCINAISCIINRISEVKVTISRRAIKYVSIGNSAIELHTY